MFSTVARLSHDDINFPDVNKALAEPNGLLAIGGDLSVARIMEAYQRGIFPWFSHNQPILWWSPDPRMVLFPEKLKISRSLKKVLKNSHYKVSFDQDFAAVVTACSEPRSDDPGTWITSDMIKAYIALHKSGHAHSVEVWDNDQLVGGLYGVSINKVFCGESMFSRAANASKIALYHLVNYVKQHGYQLIDCQVSSEHLESLGAEEISRDEYISILSRE